MPSKKGCYLGCYGDTWERDIANDFTVADMNIQLCIDLCTNNGFLYAGVQAGY